MKKFKLLCWLNLLLLALNLPASSAQEMFKEISDGRSYYMRLQSSFYPSSYNPEFDPLFELHKANLAKSGDLKNLEAALPSMASLAVAFCKASIENSFTAKDYFRKLLDREPRAEELEELFLPFIREAANQDLDNRPLSAEEKQSLDIATNGFSGQIAWGDFMLSTCLSVALSPEFFKAFL